MRSGQIPSLIHHTASADNPCTATVANGGPLSLRITSGKPYSRNVASIRGRTWAPSGCSIVWQHSR